MSSSSKFYNLRIFKVSDSGPRAYVVVSTDEAVKLISPLSPGLEESPVGPLESTSNVTILIRYRGFFRSWVEKKYCGAVSTLRSEENKEKEHPDQFNFTFPEDDGFTITISLEDVTAQHLECLGDAAVEKESDKAIEYYQRAFDSRKDKPKFPQDKLRCKLFDAYIGALHCAIEDILSNQSDASEKGSIRWATHRKVASAYDQKGNALDGLIKYGLNEKEVIREGDKCCSFTDSLEVVRSAVLEAYEQAWHYRIGRYRNVSTKQDRLKSTTSSSTDQTQLCTDDDLFEAVELLRPVKHQHGPDDESD